MHDFHTAKFSHVAKYTKKVVMVILWSILSTRQVTMGSNILFVNGYRYDWGDLGEKEAFGHNKNNKKKRETIQRGNRMKTRIRVYTRQ